MWLRSLVGVLAVVVAGFGVSGAQAQGQQLERLSSYIGSWSGDSALVGPNRNEPFRCRLAVSQGVGLKINYTGRCTLVNATLSISGTIAYNNAAGQYEAVMSSNAGFTGLAIGQQQGDRISFDLREQQRDRAGTEVRIGAKIFLVGDSITVDYEVEFYDSGDILTASVPFSR